jgi:hypothetical protein
MTRKSTQAIPVANPNTRCEMVGQSPELECPYLRTIGLQAVEVAFSGVAWFVAVLWLNFVGGPRLGLTVVMVAGMLVMFTTLLLLAISRVIDHPQWRLPRVDALLGMALLRVNVATMGWLGRPALGPWHV